MVLVSVPPFESFYEEHRNAVLGELLPLLDTGDDGVATITLDSQHNRNALSRQLVGELFERLARAEDDEDVKVVVIRAEGRTFCSGADLSEASDEGMEKAAGVLVDLQRRSRFRPRRSGGSRARIRSRR